MIADMERYGYNTSFSSLRPLFNGTAPDDAFSTVPYEKGYQFIYYLQSIVGKDIFQTFLQTYIELNAESSIDWTVTKRNWIDFVTANVTDTDIKTKALGVDWDYWVTVGGPFSSKYAADVNFTSDDQIEAETFADTYVALGGKSGPDNAAATWDKFYSNKKVVFTLKLLDRLRENKVSYQVVAKIDADLKLTSTQNPEVWQ